MSYSSQNFRHFSAWQSFCYCFISLKQTITQYIQPKVIVVLVKIYVLVLIWKVCSSPSHVICTSMYYISMLPLHCNGIDRYNKINQKITIKQRNYLFELKKLNYRQRRFLPLKCCCFAMPLSKTLFLKTCTLLILYLPHRVSVCIHGQPFLPDLCWQKI